LGLSIARIDTPISINLLQDSGYRQSTGSCFEGLIMFHNQTQES
jgi:hypothetical protein